MARYEWNSKYIVKTPNTELAVTLDNMKSFLKIDTTADDALITSLIKTTTSLAESYMGIEILKKTFTMYMDFFPFDKRYGNRVEENFNQYTIQVKRSPLDSITHIKYFSATVLTTLDNTLYDFSQDTQYSRIYLIDDDSIWPTVDDRKQAVEIEFIAGIAEDDPEVPDDIKTAIKRIVSYLYFNRGDCTDSKSCNVCVLAGAAPLLDFHAILEI